jgi:hypothetical protein
MRVFNLTDMLTPVLESSGFINKQIVVHKHPVNPGEFVSVIDSEHIRVKLKKLLTIGAISIDQLPPSYIGFRRSEELKKSNPEKLSHHVNIRETSTGVPELNRGLNMREPILLNKRVS